ncbi:MULTISPECIES: enoyl-CoA hydratase/isomerase family protein [Rhodobacterales]|uniref:enoyl-CoA hydratase/isomerase family protein n=1 Tax=Rhodobacterales TaxID=204455 RepID=UPI000C8EAA4B|nr:enoyl-CoA hydratase-related protein [Heliomarina baculiformis]MAM24172.1 enoyl-CoA hydratase [Paracoccaceae bacterium]HCQ56767.1 enoyl-CoA hydratase [Sulfitobacter sp.]|tara:strand:- start:913 stop:1689 length:777 start_codon:yes stop_codon:yes gene_type:complete
MASDITVEHSEGLAIVSLNRPDKLNALTLEMRVELMDTFRDIQTDPQIRAVLFRAEGRAFCAGADISTMGKDDVWGDRARLYRAHQMILSIFNCEKPVVAAVRGPAVGIGLSMALACDVVLLSETAKLGQVFRKVGLAPDGGAAFFLQNLIGRQRATDLAFSARLVPADEALSLGLASQVHSDDALDTAALDYAADLAAGPTFALAGTKRLMRAAMQPSLESFLETEAIVQGQIIKSTDHAEGIDAFLSKRKPVFRGA